MRHILVNILDAAQHTQQMGRSEHQQCASALSMCSRIAVVLTGAQHTPQIRKPAPNNISCCCQVHFGPAHA
jgi:hypothetical protein